MPPRPYGRGVRSQRHLRRLVRGFYAPERPMDRSADSYTSERGRGHSKTVRGSAVLVFRNQETESAL